MVPGSDTTPAVAFSSSRFTDPENPPPRATAAEEHRDEEKSSCCGAGNMACWMAAMILLYLWAADGRPDPRYSVAIDSFSGLLASNRTTTDLALLDHPEFNLTLRVASFSRRAHACLDPGTYVEVAYRCVTLAATATSQERLCAGPMQAADQELVARGTGVQVPGPVLDILVADMRLGAPAFQVTIRWSSGDYAECGDRHVGAANQDLGTSCDAQHLCPNSTAKDGSH